MKIGMTLMAAAVVLAACSGPKGESGDGATLVEAGSASAQTPAKQAPQKVSGPAKALPADAVQVQVVQIMDPGGFGSPMVAARALVPAGWKTEGGVKWAQSVQCVDPATFQWAAISPDGASRIELFPTEAWQASNSGVRQECQYGEMQDMKSYLAAYIMRRYPGAQPGQFRQRMDFLDAQKDYIQARIAMINNSGTGMRAWADAGELEYTHNEGGKDVSGLVAASGMFYGSQLANPLGGPPLMTITGGTNATFHARAPKGQLDLKKIEAMRKSVKLDPKWAQEMFKLQAKLGQIQTQGVRERAAIIVAGGAAMTASTIAANNAATQGYADRMAASDRQQRERIESIRGVETYDDPVYGGQVQLDNTFDHAWRVSNAESYILTNDPNFNPGAYNIEAQQLKVTQ
jgi:hypothetical protein